MTRAFLRPCKFGDGTYYLSIFLEATTKGYFEIEGQNDEIYEHELLYVEIPKWNIMLLSTPTWTWTLTLSNNVMEDKEYTKRKNWSFVPTTWNDTKTKKRDIEAK